MALSNFDLVVGILNNLALSAKVIVFPGLRAHGLNFLMVEENRLRYPSLVAIQALLPDLNIAGLQQILARVHVFMFLMIFQYMIHGWQMLGALGT
jgi:hypothetical protein